MSGSSRSSRLRAELAAAAEGQFEIVREIGRGGMGWVFLARDLRLNRRVALKVLSPRMLMEDGMGERFLREAQILASLRHAHLVGVHSVHHAGDLHFFSMDFIDGPALDQVLRIQPRLSVVVTKAIAYMVGSALDYGHHRGRGVIHRDIKPANVLLDSDGSVVVTDFGISKVLTGGTKLTRTGLVVGTPEFMSPEQCTGGEVTPASDQYSLGVMLYQMLCGRPPFVGGAVEVLLAHVRDEPEPVLSLRPDCPVDLAAAVDRMLAKAAEDRFPDIGSAIAAAGAEQSGFRSPGRAAVADCARLAMSDTGAIDISSPLSPARAQAPVHDSEPSLATVSSLFIASPRERLRTGESVPIWVDVRDAMGRAVPEASVRLTVDNPSLATLGEGGLLVAREAGTVTVTATTGEIERHVTFEIFDPPRPSRVLIDPPEVDLEVGDSVRLAVTILDAEGIEMDDVSPEWELEDSTAFTLEGGLLRAEGPGVATVTARVGLISATALARARRAAAAILFDQAPTAIGVGDSEVVTALVVDAQGVPLDASEVEWSSSNPSIADVDRRGRVHARTPGRVEIRASSGSISAAHWLDVADRAESGSTVAAPVALPSLEATPVGAATAVGGPREADEARAETGPPRLRRVALLGGAVMAVAFATWWTTGREEVDAPLAFEEGLPANELTTSGPGEGESSPVESAEESAPPINRDVEPPPPARDDPPEAPAGATGTLAGEQPASTEEASVEPIATEAPSSVPPTSANPAAPPAVIDSAAVTIMNPRFGVLYLNGVPFPDTVPERDHSFRLAPATYEIRLVRPGFIPFDTLVTLVPGQELNMTVRLEPGGM